MSAHWVWLTSDSGGKILVNLGNIDYITPRSSHGSILSKLGEETDIYAYEGPEQIAALIPFVGAIPGNYRHASEPSCPPTTSSATDSLEPPASSLSGPTARS